MNTDAIKTFIELYPQWSLVIVLAASFLVYLLGRVIIGRVLVYLAGRTATQVDDMIVQHLHPYRVAWIAPLVLISSHRCCAYSHAENLSPCGAGLMNGSSPKLV